MKKRPLCSLAAASLAVLCSAGCSSDGSEATSAAPSAGSAAISGAGGALGGSAGASRAGAGGAVNGGNAGSSAGAAGAGVGGSAGAQLAGSGGMAGAGAGAAGSSGSAGSAGALIDHQATGSIVVLGSSTAAGTGPLDPKNAWVERYRSYLGTEFPKLTLTNLAVGGYATADIQPSDYVHPGNPDHNITKALTLKPDAIIINMPTNDTEYGVSVDTQMANFARVTDLATKNGVPCWVTTSQPRNFSGESAADVQKKRQVLIAVKGDIEAKYGAHSIDFWTQYANADGSIKVEFAKPDGIHMNDAGHALLVQDVIAAKIPEAVIAAKH